MAGRNIAVIGNSHVAAIKAGHDHLVSNGELDGVEVTWFAARSTTILGLECSDGPDGHPVLGPGNEALRLAISHTAAGREFVDFRLYDECLLVGINRVPLCDSRVSSAARRWAFSGVPQHSGLAKLVSDIRACGTVPIRALPMPLPSEQPELRPGYTPMPYRQRVAELATYVDAGDFAFMPQPAATVDAEVSTRPHFSIGSTRLDVGDEHSGVEHDSRDLDHMNAEFGAMVIRELLREPVSTA